MPKSVTVNKSENPIKEKKDFKFKVKAPGEARSELDERRDLKAIAAITAPKSRAQPGNEVALEELQFETSWRHEMPKENQPPETVQNSAFLSESAMIRRSFKQSVKKQVGFRTREEYLSALKIKGSADGGTGESALDEILTNYFETNSQGKKHLEKAQQLLRILND